MHPTEFDRAVEAAKLQALYNFAYGLSHEVNNPLANIATRAQTLLADETAPERRRKLATIVQQAFKAHEMIADLMLFARPPAMKPEMVDLALLADTVVAELAEQAREQDTHLVRTGDAGPLLANADPTQIAVALRALIQNSLEALKAGGSVAVEAARVRSSEINGTPVLSVADTGPGISPNIRPHIFDPYYSGREAGRGLGLGLSKAWRIAELHGGRIEVESEPGRGAKFSIVLSAGD